jgi:hypothetical protein
MRDGTAYADVNINGHRETLAISKGSAFKQLLAREYFHADLGVPNKEAVTSAIGILEASARYDSPEREVYIRLAEDSGNYYIDLGDKDWQAIEIDANGWRIVAEPPVRFRRPAGMQPLTMPSHGGDLSHLREFLNVSESGFVLVVAWLLAALTPTGPYPVLAVSGEQGTAKSSLTRILKALTDPSKVSVKTLPREERELVIALIAFDNVSRISDWVSDALCRLATVGGKLYANFTLTVTRFCSISSVRSSSTASKRW